MPTTATPRLFEWAITNRNSNNACNNNNGVLQNEQQKRRWRHTKLATTTTTTTTSFVTINQYGITYEMDSTLNNNGVRGLNTQQWRQPVTYNNNTANGNASKNAIDTQGIGYQNDSIQYSTMFLQAEALVYLIIMEWETRSIFDTQQI